MIGKRKREGDERTENISDDESTTSDFEIEEANQQRESESSRTTSLEEVHRARRAREDGRVMKHLPPAHVFVIHSPERASWNGAQLVLLPHARLGEAWYLLEANGELQQVQQMRPDRQLGSWFIDQTISNDGSLYFTTPVDPLFVLLPLLRRSAQEKADSGKAYFRSFEDIVAQERKARPLLLHAATIEPHLKLICETTVMPGAAKQQLFRLDDDKLLRWLQAKVIHVHEGLQRLPTSRWHTSSRSSAISSFTSGGSAAEQEEESVPATTRLLLSFRLVTDFLPDSLAALLRTSFGDALPTPNKQLSSKLSFSSRATSDPHFLAHYHGGGGGSSDGHDDEDPAVKANKQSISFQAKRLAKVNTKGFGKMTSFFKKRSKPNEE